MTSVKLAVIVGSTRQNRFSEKPAKWISGEVQKLEGVEAQYWDLREHALPYYDEPFSPSTVQGAYPNPQIQKWAEKVAWADGFIVVTPEYNHGYPAVLKNAFDCVYKEWNNKPIGFVSYGSVGGARSVEQLRLVAIELQMAPIRTGVHIPGATVFPIMMGKAEWNTELEASLKPNADTMLGQLLWWTKALKAARG